MHPRKFVAESDECVEKGIQKIETDQFENALYFFDRAISINPQNVFALIYLGIIYREKNDFDSAHRYFKNAEAINPNDANIYLQRGITFIKQNYFKDALENFHRAVEKNPHKALTYLYRAFANLRLKNIEAGLDDLRVSLKLSEYAATYELRQIAVGAHLIRGNFNLEKNHLNAAYADYDNAIILDPFNSVAHRKIGIIYSKLGNFKLAEKYLLAAVNLKPTEVNYNVLGNLYFGQGKIEKALETFTLVIKLHPLAFSALINQGVVFLQTHRIDEAIIVLSKVLQKKSDTLSFMHRANAYLTKERYADAFNDFEQALINAKNNSFKAAIYYHRGKANLLRGDNQKAKEDFKSVWELSSEGGLIKICSGIQLLILNNNISEIDFLFQFDKFSQKKITTAEEFCALALGKCVTGKYNEAKEICYSILRVFLPQAIPYFLQNDFLEMLTHPAISLPAVTRQVEYLNVDILKEQLKNLIIHSNTNLKLTSGLQALCSGTFLGRLFYFQRHILKPSIKSGRLFSIATALNEFIQFSAGSFHIDNYTKEELRNEARINPYFVQDIKKNFPHLFEVIESYLPKITNVTSYNFFQRISLTPQPVIKNEIELSIL